MSEDIKRLESATVESAEPLVVLDAEEAEKLELLDKAKSREGKEPIPHLKINIFFGFHGSYEDSRGLEKEFSDSDIYAPELSGWTDLDNQLFVELSQGRITPEQFMKESGSSKSPMAGFFRKQAEMVHRSFKPIVFLDLPAGNPLHEALIMNLKKWGDLRPGLYDFRKVIAEVKSLIKEEADLHSQREDFMLGRLYAGVKEVLARRPDLAGKKSLKVTMFLGAAHTRVSHLLQEYGQEVSRKFSHNPLVYPLGTEAERRYAMGKPVENDLAARVLLERFASVPLGMLAERFTVDNHETVTFMRKIESTMSYDDIKDIFSAPPDIAPIVFINLLAKKNVSIPKTPKEFQQFISK